MKYSVIIPTYNAQRHLEGCIRSVCAALPESEIIVSDGGSLDKTRDIGVREKARVIDSPKGRGVQLNRGAARAAGKIFLFLHCDSRLDPEAGRVLETWFARGDVQSGKFTLKFDRDSRLLGLYAALARFDSFLTSFGDQGIVVRKELFWRLDGFPEWPLLEDVRFLQKARRITKIHTLPAVVTTSAERFLQNGVIRQQWLNAGILMKYRLGHSPARLASQYEKGGTRDEGIL